MTSIKDQVVTEKAPTISGESAPEGKVIVSLKKHKTKVFFGLGAFFGALAQGEGVLKALTDVAKALFVS